MAKQVWATYAAVLVLLGACAPYSQTKGPLHEGMGNAVRHNMAQQIVNPEPESANKAEPEMDGQRAGLAMERYHTGTVKDATAPVSTSAGSGGN